MTRLTPVAVLLFLSACATSRTPQSAAPEPQPETAATPAGSPNAAERPRATPQRSRPAATTDAEVDAEVQAVSDSLADAEALEQLADVDLPDDSSDLSPALTADLDISSFTEHDRVKYYVRFFSGPGRERMQIWLQRLPRYEAMIRAHLGERGLPGDLVYLALIESGFSNRAVSRASAVGMWQFMAPTGRAYGLRIDNWVDERRDPVKATGAAARHLRDLQQRFGSLYLAAAAYNGGAGRVGRGLTKLGDGDDEGHSDASFFRLYNTSLIHRETKDYVPKLIAAALIGRDPSAYGFVLDSVDTPFAADTVKVDNMTGLDIIAQLADTTLASIREFNPHILRLVTPPGTPFIVMVPAGRGAEAQAAYDVLPDSSRLGYRDHKAKKGETTALLAQRYGTTAAAIEEANPGTKGRALAAGQRVMVPIGGPMSIVVARAVTEPAKPTVQIHRVKSGETLTHVASRYHVSVASLKQWNGLKSSRIRVGQRLRIGATSTERARTASAALRTHVVKSGETLSGVAKRYGVSLQALSKANGLTTKSHLRIGQRLRVPR